MRIGILILILFYNSCQKKVCKLTRYDLATIYLVHKSTDSFYLKLWKIPMSASDDIPLEVMDSFNNLKAKGYKVSFTEGPYSLVYDYADCNECDKLSKKNISSECKEYN